MALRSIVFTSSGSWTAPSNVSKVIVEGFGGGGGGGGGSSPSVAFGNTIGMGGGGGGGSLYHSKTITVVPGTTYTITVGAGGTGGAGGASPTTPGAVGSNGDDSSFGSLFIMPGASGGGKGILLGEGSLAANTSYHSLGGPSVKLGNMLPDLLSATYVSPNLYQLLPGIGYGGNGSLYNVTSTTYSNAMSGMPNIYTTSFSSPGLPGSVDGSYDPGGGGGGGGNGPEGVGGNGGSGGNGINGAAISATNGGNGVSAAANTGAGGGGGGGAGQSNGGGQTGGNGGTGGSGLVIITFDL